MPNKIKLLDVVALIENLPEQNLAVGQVGTVVEIHDNQVFEVEFCDNEGRTYALVALHAKSLMPLLYAPVAA